MWEERPVWVEITKSYYEELLKKDKIVRRDYTDEIKKKYRGLLHSISFEKDIRDGKVIPQDDWYRYYYEDISSPMYVYVCGKEEAELLANNNDYHEAVASSRPKGKYKHVQYKPKHDHMAKFFKELEATVIKNGGFL